ncbi:hypothetical protein [Amycolatopsis sp. CA-128772]|uniref:hypothetical protein n=1 Tax=Amycolatopsis sp. CA-128772 TaxID=2073159 RepID=UPI002712109A|nr:hypothetical protein [Amycolatopsis sp. CA-128772]
MRAAPGLRVLPAWTEALFAVVSARHPAAGRAGIAVAELATGPLRTARDHDLPAGVLPGPGAPVRAGMVQDTIVEVGSDPRSWTVLAADQVAEIRSARVRAIPLEPRTTVTGSVVVPDDLPDTCAAAHRSAFGG